MLGVQRSARSGSLMSKKNYQDSSLSFDFGEEQTEAEDLNRDQSVAFCGTAEPREAMGSLEKQVESSGSKKDQPEASGIKSNSLVAAGSKKERAGHKGSEKSRQKFELNPNFVQEEALFDVDQPKRRNVGYRVRRDLRQESLIDMPMFITGVEIRDGVAADDRAWNKKFSTLREEITIEINNLRFLLGDKMGLEVVWQNPLGWPIVALRAPDGKRIIETDSAQLWAYGVRSLTMVWKSIVEKQQTMQKMARDYEALLRWADKLPKKIGLAMDGSRSLPLILDPEISKQINSLPWPNYFRDSNGAPFSPLPYSVYEAMRVRLWAHTKALKHHVHAMNLNYNIVDNPRKIAHGKTRPAALAVGIVDGPCRTPQHYWALWVRKGQENLFYRVVTPRTISSERGEYINGESFSVSDDEKRLRTYAIDRCHLSHMKDIYRAADAVLADLLDLSEKTASLIEKTMGKHYGQQSPASAGRGSWRGSGAFFKWIPGQ